VNRFVYSFALIGFGLVGAGCSDKEVGSGSGVAGSTPAVAAAQEEVTQERIGLPRDQIEGEILGEATGFLDGVPFTLYALNQQVEGYDEPVRTVHLSKVHDGYRLLVYFHPESVERRNNSLHLNLDLTPDLSLDEHKLGMYFTSPWVGYHFSGDFLTSFKAEWVVEAVFVNKDVAFIDYAAFTNGGFSAHNSFGGFSHTSPALSQFRVGPAHRCGCSAFAAS